MACNNYIPCYIIWAAARWTANTYTISFDSNTATSGSVPANQNFTPGQAATTLSVPAPGSLVKPFYSFGGWSATAGGTSKVTSYNSIGDKIFYAIWNPVSNKVTFNSNGAGSTVSPSSATSTGGSLVTLPTPTRTGYTVSGWFDAASGGNKVGDAGGTYRPESAITIHAQWTPNSNTVTFKANDGTETTSSQSITTGATTALTANSFIRTGYTFTGWNTNSSGNGTQLTNSQRVTLSAGLILFATWRANVNTITFNANYGSGATATQSITSGVATALRSNTFTRAGYRFVGWGSNSSGGDPTYSNGASVTVTSGLTLWARWIKS
jgi:uncharacterized repeat protein (TIGR02543 family)